MCLLREWEVEVARISVVQKMSYADAVLREEEEDGSRVRDPKRIPVSRPRPIDIDRNNMSFSKVVFLPFIGCEL